MFDSVEHSGGVKWDKENITLGKEEHFNFEDAKAIARLAGKRLPSKENFEALFAEGSTLTY